MFPARWFQHLSLSAERNQLHLPATYYFSNLSNGDASNLFWNATVSASREKQFVLFAAVQSKLQSLRG